MIKILLIIGILCIIYAIFYRQANNEYTVLQLEYSKIDKLSESLNDKLPIIINNVPLPINILPTSLLKTPRFSAILGDYLERRKGIEIPKGLELSLAEETGFNVHGIHTWKPKLDYIFISNYISSIKSYIYMGNRGVKQTKAINTVIIPIVGTYICSIISQKYEGEVKKIEGNKIIGDIQYIDVILRSGYVLILPAHWSYIMTEAEEYSYYGVHEYHEPISLIGEYLEKRV